MSNDPDILQKMFENPNALRRSLPKRFYTTVSLGEVEGGLSVLLDGRTVKTPAKKTLVLPNRPIADAVHGEWMRQGERIDPGTMPVARLSNTVVDAVAPDPAPVLNEVPLYAETDLLVYRAAHPDELVERQRERWDPIVEWASDTLGARFVLAEGVMHVAQPAEALAAFKARIAPLKDPWTIAGLQLATALSGSALLALALLEGRLAPDEAWELSRLDENWNVEHWGADEEARIAARYKQADFEAAALLMGRAANVQ
ncbi:ATP12 family protein [Fulvimarina sp. 2208YS6-2-32]|uniref:ATP12 family protein n=1 Tax=Fulvimarina uroteuthidis TaxID=3098149 RepID=A0ABU5I746_9HYPH|nr:ATP12 family protein [Fulvimarina sp. 2208YS6-2-32]MDY8110649.1 ATP12 family protein [Fulvimarina sp. 2208YS6-2-32]